ncbi:MAG TPA: SprT family zinc-dependent metalloprotease [Patescibacteria group bacterium]|nr:SprT family zinc-dependent metalloprotease [Patescibacteria group bacterium]
MTSRTQPPALPSTARTTMSFKGSATPKTDSVTLGGYSFEYTVRYSSRRKTVQLRLSAPTRLDITAPRGFSPHNLEKVLQEKSAWILRSSSRLAMTDTAPVNQRVASGEKVLYLGQYHTLLLLPGPAAAITVAADQIRLQYPQSWDHVPHSDLRIQDFLRSWYVEQATRLLLEKTRQWSPVIGVRPGMIRIKEQKSRWGSCSSLGNVNYNWRLIMAPPEIVDYLVVHELCHLLEGNHSGRFWSIVRHHLPDYAASRLWLKQNGRLLSRLLAK